MNIGTAAIELADQLSAVTGVSVTADPEHLVIPGGYLVPEELNLSRLDGSTLDATWRLYLIAGDVSTPAALDAIGDLLDRVKEYGSGRAEFVMLALPNYASNGLPALSILIPTEITEE